MLEKYTLPPLPKYANYPNINAKFQIGTAAINRHDLGFPERAFMYKNISKDTAESCGKSTSVRIRRLGVVPASSPNYLYTVGQLT